LQLWLNLISLCNLALKIHVASDDFKKSIPKYPEKKKSLENMVNKLTEFDNPVLMFVTFK